MVHTQHQVNNNVGYRYLKVFHLFKKYTVSKTHTLHTQILQNTIYTLSYFQVHHIQSEPILWYKPFLMIKILNKLTTHIHTPLGLHIQMPTYTTTPFSNKWINLSSTVKYPLLKKYDYIVLTYINTVIAGITFVPVTLITWTVLHNQLSGSVQC